MSFTFTREWKRICVLAVLQLDMVTSLCFLERQYKVKIRKNDSVKHKAAVYIVLSAAKKSIMIWVKCTNELIIFVPYKKQWTATAEWSWPAVGSHTC